MTREEEIRQVSENYGNQKYSDGINALICAEDFKEGVNWADQHPRKGLWDSKKIIKFIKDNVREYHKSGVFHVDDFINDLTKTMEE